MKKLSIGLNPISLREIIFKKKNDLSVLYCILILIFSKDLLNDPRTLLCTLM